MTEIATAHDVRLLCDDANTLAERVHIARLTLASRLPSRYDMQRAQYHDPTAIVPDPATFRRCTPEEIAAYVLPANTQRRPSDVVLYVGREAQRLQDAFDATAPPRWFGHTSSEPGQLTTTLHDTTASIPTKEGMHVDSGESFIHRLGVCIAGRRQLLVATRPAQQLLGEGAALSTSAVRERLAQNPHLLGDLACLSITFEAGEAYDAWTGTLLHDGSTWHTNRGEGNASASAVIFAPL